MPRRGLGRGLDLLIPAEDSASDGLLQVEVDRIVPNPHQPRTLLSETSLGGLADSIREHGVIQPLVVTKLPAGGYQLIAGERRWRASQLAGLEKVPVIVKEAAPQKMLELALVENIQRADLNPLEEAVAYHHLVEEFGLSQSEVARRVGKSRPAVNNVMRLLSAGPAIQQALLDGAITEGHGRALLGLETPEAQAAALQTVLTKELTVRGTEALVRRLRGRAETSEPPVAEPEDPHIHELEERFQAALGTRVRVKHGKKQGRVVIYYYSDEEFQALYQRLTGDEL
ncbi:MAG: ParB/RepB/Spo0J family partition protein [Anaerolineae bacterium]|nr:ParB/RepB/Spo0J family partition protein [Anaerolineae bacterium]